MKSIIILISLLIVGCDWAEVKEVDPRFFTHIEEFHHEARERGFNINLYGDISIEFADDIICGGTPSRGCSSPGGHIRISRYYESISTRTETEIILFHEIGHAYFGFDHSDDTLDIMHKYLVDKTYYIANREDVLDKFFAK